MRVWRQLLLATGLIACGWSTPLPAEEITVELANGDRLSGQLISQVDGLLVFLSPVLGELRLTADQAEIITTQAEDTPADTTAMAEALAGTPPPPPAATRSADPKPWKSSIEFGFQQQSGQRDSLNLNLRALAELKHGLSNYQAEGRLLYGEQQSRANVDRADASLRWRRNLSPDFFAQTVTSYSRDNIRGIEHNWEQNVGAGYRLFSADVHTLNVGAGFTGQYRSNRGVAPGAYGLVEVFQDYTYRINGRLTLRQNTIAQYTPDGQGSFIIIPNQPRATPDGEPNYKVRFNTELQGKITERISLNVRYEYEYDNAIVAINAEGDQRITSSIGYAF